MAAAELNRLDEEALERYLAASIEGFRGPVAMTKFDGGQSNPTYALDAASGRYVLRRKPPGQLLKSAHAVDREFRVMQALSATDVPVPRMRVLCEDESVAGTAFFVMDRVEGRVLWDPALPGMTNQERGAIYDAMNRVLAALHSIDPQAVGLGDYGKPGNYYERQLSRWTQQYRASETETIAAMDALIAWLADRVPKDDGRVAIVHGDYRIDNIIFAADAPVVHAVLDWELSTLGHPYADLAYQCMQWRLPNLGHRGLAGIDRHAIGIPSEEAYVAVYCERRGITAIDNWTFYLAFSFFRLGAILQGVFKRALDGNASNPERARATGGNVVVLADMAMDMIGTELPFVNVADPAGTGCRMRRLPCIHSP